ncbi:MAG: cupin domain-containing protein [Spirochaetes bacterium]|nr:cupin domain-containing protein [Spirochaetota bacterium]
MAGNDATAIAAALGLEPLPGEGGFFRRTWTAAETLADGRAAGSAILFMETDAPEGFSALHRLSGDEIYHFYSGDPVELSMIAPDGRASTVVLGPDPLAGQSPQAVAPAGWFQGSRLAPGGRWALLGTTMAPAYDEGSFYLPSRSELIGLYPRLARLIERLTR